MSTTPYENEPGFEDANSAPDKVLKKSYNQKVYLVSPMLSRG